MITSGCSNEAGESQGSDMFRQAHNAPANAFSDAHARADTHDHRQLRVDLHRQCCGIMRAPASGGLGRTAWPGKRRP